MNDKKDLGLKEEECWWKVDDRWKLAQKWRFLEGQS